MHIFISYAKIDIRQLATRLYEALNSLPDVTAWMDQSLEAGTSWAVQIQNEIDRADYVVVLLSPDVNRPESDNQHRSFVLNEIDYAQYAHKPIIPIMAIKTRVPVQIAGIQYIDITDIAGVKAKILKILQEIDRRAKLSPDQTISLSSYTALNPSKKRFHLNEPWAIILAAIITGIFALLAAYIATSHSDDNASPTPHNTKVSIVDTATVTDTSNPSETPSATSTKTFTLTNTPSNTPSPTTSLTSTSTVSPTEEPTNIPSSTPTGNFTNTPSSTGTPVATLTNTATLVLTISPSNTPGIVTLGTYPCEATIMGAGMTLRIVYPLPNHNLSPIDNLSRNQTVIILAKELNGGRYWYKLRYGDNLREGWVLDNYIQVSESCPQ